MPRKCVLKHVVHDRADPNDVPIEAIHASNIRLMTQFMCHPSPELALLVIRMLEALAAHEDRFGSDGEVNVYAQATAAWQRLLHDAAHEDASTHSAHTLVH